MTGVNKYDIAIATLDTLIDNAHKLEVTMIDKYGIAYVGLVRALEIVTASKLKEEKLNSMPSAHQSFQEGYSAAMELFSKELQLCHSQRPIQIVLPKNSVFVEPKQQSAAPNNSEKVVICSKSICEYCSKALISCERLSNFRCFEGRKLTPISS